MDAENVNFANHLTPRAMKIMDMVISGFKSGAIAEKLGLTLPYVSKVVHAPQFEHQLAIRRNRYEETFDKDLIDAEHDAMQILKDKAAAAAQKMVDLMEDDSPTIQHKSAADIMDRVGPTKQTKNLDISQTNIIIDEGMANLIKETLSMDKPKVKQIESKEKAPDE